MATEKQTKQMQDIQRALNLLSLTQTNQKLAEQYMNVAIPEDSSLLEGIEHQNFENLQRSIKCDLYRFLEIYKQIKTEVAGRFICLVAAIGGETSSCILAYQETFSDINYLEKFLPPLQKAVIHANMVAWNARNFSANFIEPLIKMGKQDPEVFPQMMGLCYNTDDVNTKMLLAALYLHCVKPLEETKSSLLFLMEKDNRAKGNPARIKEMTAYLEHCLIRNINGLFDGKSQPEKAELEILQNFVRDAGLQVPISKEILAILSGKDKHYYRMAFLPFLAFLAVEHSDRFVSMIRLTVSLDAQNTQNIPLNNCLAAGETWFCRHISVLEQYLEISDNVYLYWALLHRQGRILERMAVKAPDVVCEIIKDVSLEEQRFLTTCIEVGNPQLYQKKREQFASDYHRAAADQATSYFSVSQKEAKSYLLGEIEIADILPCVQGWRDMKISGYWSDRCKKIYDNKVFGELQIYRRALVLECLRLDRDYFAHYWVDSNLKQSEGTSKYKDIDVRQAKGILKLLEEENVPPLYQIEFLSTIYDDNYYAPYYEENAYQDCLEIIASYHNDWHEEWRAASKSRFLPARILAIRVMEIQWEECKYDLLSCITESSKQGRALIYAACTAHQDCEKDMLMLLKSLRGTEREMAVKVLGGWGVESYRVSLTEAFKAERTKKIRTLIQEMLGIVSQENDGENTKKQTIEELIRETLTGAWKRKLSWLPLDILPKVHKNDKEQASTEYMAAILISYADMRELGRNENAQKLTTELNPVELASYVREVYNFWLSEGAQAKRKWVLYVASIYGDEAIVTQLYTQIQSWAQNMRSVMAAEAVKALALNATPIALVFVDQIFRKFRQRQVKAAAAKALDYAAEQNGISREEMEDKIIPTLGFDAQMKRTFDYGKRKFQVLLTPSFSLEIYNEKGKQLKNMPAHGKSDDLELSTAAYNAWKQLKKQLSIIVTNQKLRLEQTLGTERKWETKKWKAVFVENPVMRQFAIGLIWGVYEGKILTQTFRYMEDGTFNTADEKVYILPRTDSIGLVHPLELSKESLSMWKKQLSDYEIVQPIRQLARPIFRVTDKEKEEMELTRFGGMVVNSLSLSKGLEDMGWYIEEVVGNGDFIYYRSDQNNRVELNFVNDGISRTDVVVYSVYFYRADIGDVACKLGEIEPRYFSEIILQLTEATASSVEKRPYPDCKNGWWH